MKRILIFSLDYYPGEVGGAEVAIKEITDRISHEAFEFHMITLHYDTSMAVVEQLGNVLVHRVGFGWRNPTIDDRKKFPLHLNKHLFQLYAPLKALWLHRQYRYDGIWAMMAHSCGIPAALFKFFKPEIPYLLTLQEGEPPAYIQKLMRPVWPLFKRAFSSADEVQVISNFLGQWAVAMGYPNNPVYIPNGVNVEHFSKSYSDADRISVQKKLGKQPGEIWLITTSRMVEKNGLDTVVRALPHLPASVHFVIYGGGPQKSTLERLAHNLSVAERVHFNGLLTHEEMPLYLKACDIFVRPSRSEGMGNSFVEAMAAGLPIIATQAGGIADFLYDAEKNPDQPTTGWAVRVDNPEDIAAAVADIMKSPEKVALVQQNALKLVQERYEWDMVAKKIGALLTKLV